MPGTQIVLVSRGRPGRRSGTRCTHAVGKPTLRASQAEMPLMHDQRGGRSYGATRAERYRRLPGDDLMAAPHGRDDACHHY